MPKDLYPGWYQPVQDGDRPHPNGSELSRPVVLNLNGMGYITSAGQARAFLEALLEFEKRLEAGDTGANPPAVADYVNRGWYDVISLVHDDDWTVGRIQALIDGLDG